MRVVVHVEHFKLMQYFVKKGEFLKNNWHFVLSKCYFAVDNYQEQFMLPIYTLSSH